MCSEELFNGWDSTSTVLLTQLYCNPHFSISYLQLAVINMFVYYLWRDIVFALFLLFRNSPVCPPALLSGLYSISAIKPQRMIVSYISNTDMCILINCCSHKSIHPSQGLKWCEPLQHRLRYYIIKVCLISYHILFDTFIVFDTMFKPSKSFYLFFSAATQCSPPLAQFLCGSVSAWASLRAHPGPLCAWQVLCLLHLTFSHSSPFMLALFIQKASHSSLPTFTHSSDLSTVFSE